LQEYQAALGVHPQAAPLTGVVQRPISSVTFNWPADTRHL